MFSKVVSVQLNRNECPALQAASIVYSKPIFIGFKAPSVRSVLQALTQFPKKTRIKLCIKQKKEPLHYTSASNHEQSLDSLD